MNLLNGDFMGISDDLTHFFNDCSAVGSNDDFNFAVMSPKVIHLLKFSCISNALFNTAAMLCYFSMIDYQ